jgi:hypothetical protein
VPSPSRRLAPARHLSLTIFPQRLTIKHQRPVSQETWAIGLLSEQLKPAAYAI